MEISKKSVDRLNDLLKEVRENKDKLVDLVLEKLCTIEECDPQLLNNKEAMNCPYFTLCNVLCSYSMQSEKEKEESDELINMFYSRLYDKHKIKESFYS